MSRRVRRLRRQPLAPTPRQELHELIDRLDDEQARRLAETLRGGGAAPTRSTSRPLSEADIVLAVPLLPDDENADITHNPDDFRGIEGLLVISEAPASS